MRKDPTEFRKRFQSWKLGIPAYRAGKPIGEDEDTRSDTTREGYNERGVPYGAGRGPAGDSPLRILDIVNEETAAIPRDKVLIGEPPAVGLRNPGIFSSDFLARAFKPKGVGRAPMFMTEEVRRNTANLKAALGTYDGRGLSLLTKQAKSWIEHNRGKVDLSLFSAEEINKLVKMNRRDLANANRDFVLVDRNPQAGNFEFDVMHNNQSVADMIGGFSGSHLVPEMVESYSKTGGMSRKLYDAAIQSGKQLGYNGLVSGEYLISAPKTWSVWKHYPDKKLISRNGRHLNRIMTNPDQEGPLVKSMHEAKKAAALNKNFTYDEGPVYLLKKESLFVPVKDKDVFDASILNPDGTFARDWNSKDITRIMLPFAVGGGLWGSKEHKNGKDLPRFADGDDVTAPNGYVRANGNPIAFDEEGNLTDQITGEKGSMRIGPNDVVVTGRDTSSYRSSFDPNAANEFTGMIPIVGDVQQGVQAVDAAKQGDYTQAALLGAGMLLPNAMEKAAKPLVPLLKKTPTTWVGKFWDFIKKPFQWFGNLFKKKSIAQPKHLLLPGENSITHEMLDDDFRNEINKYYSAKLASETTDPNYLRSFRDVNNFLMGPMYKLRVASDAGYNTWLNVVNRLLDNLKTTKVVLNPRYILYEDPASPTGWGAYGADYAGIHSGGRVSVFSDSADDIYDHEFLHAANRPSDTNPYHVVNQHNLKYKMKPLKPGGGFDIEEETQRVRAGMMDMLKRGYDYNSYDDIDRYLSLPIKELPENVQQLIGVYGRKQTREALRRFWGVTGVATAGAAASAGTNEPGYKRGKDLPRFAQGDDTIPYTSKDGAQYNIDPNVVGAKQLEVTSPDVVITGRDLSKPYRSAYAFNPSNVEADILDAVKQRAYNSITPIGYDIPKVVREFISGERDDNYHAYAPMREALWAHYLGLPSFEYLGGTGNTSDWIVESPYQPTKGVATYGKTYRFNPEKFSYTPQEGLWESYLSDDKVRRYFRERSRQGKDNVQFTDGSSDLGPYVMGSGRDENGYYVSYYDDWDINIGEGDSAPDWAKKLRSILPTGDMLQQFLNTHPISMYDRRYLTEEEWKRLGGYRNGKDIYIKPSHRGRFTALKKRTGHSASWFKAHGTPALKKMATFALNARKWKH